MRQAGQTGLPPRKNVKAQPVDTGFAQALQETLSEWDSPEDDEAYADLSMAYIWSLHTFESLSVAQWHQCLSLRCRVFVVEQQCAYQDVDDKDPPSHHLLGWKQTPSNQRLVAYARILPPGVKREQFSKTPHV